LDHLEPSITFIEDDVASAWQMTALQMLQRYRASLTLALQLDEGDSVEALSNWAEDVLVCESNLIQHILNVPQPTEQSQPANVCCGQPDICSKVCPLVIANIRNQIRSWEVKHSPETFEPDLNYPIVGSTVNCDVAPQGNSRPT
jgi:hypothetical protein